MNEEEKYSELRKKLRSLPGVRAGKDFESKLFQRIRLVSSEGLSRTPDTRHGRLAGRENWLSNIFKQPMFAPAVALTSVLIVGLVIYFAFFTQSPPTETSTEQTPGIQKQYSTTQLETLKSKVGNLKSETGREFATLDASPVEPPKSRTNFGETVTDIRSKSEKDVMEEQVKTEEGALEKTAGPERMEKMDKLEKTEKKEAPPIEKIEGKLKVDETIRQSVVPSNQNETVGEKQQSDSSGDTTKTVITGKNKKAKKKKN